MKSCFFACALAFAAWPCCAAQGGPGQAGGFDIPAALRSEALFQEWNQGRTAFGRAPKDMLPFAMPDTLPRFHVLPRGLPVPDMQPKAAGEVVARLDLGKDMDKYLITDLVFRTRGGKAFHIAANRVGNCADGSSSCGEENKYYIIFTTDQGEMYSANAYQIANYSVFKSGKKDIAFDKGAAAYTVRLRLTGMDAAAVRDGSLEISFGRQVLFTATINQIIAALTKEGVPARLDKDYMAFLGRDLLQTPGQDCYFGKTASLNMIPADSQDAGGITTLALSGITAAGVVYAPFKGYAFRQIPGRAVEIYKLN